MKFVFYYKGISGVPAQILLYYVSFWKNGISSSSADETKRICVGEVI